MYAVFIEASSAIRRVLPSPALRFRGASVCVEAGGDGSWSPGPKQTQELGHLNLELAQPVGPSGADKDSRLRSRLPQSDRTFCLTFSGATQ